MGATLSLCWLSPGWIYFAYVGWLFRNGQINEREAKNHPQRNVLQKVLGADPQQIEPQTGAVGLEPGDRFLLCTDGVTEGLFDSRIEDILRSPPVRPLRFWFARQSQLPAATMGRRWW